MPQHRTRAKDLRRKPAVRPERRTIVVFCEGRESEPDYINGLKTVPEIGHSVAIWIEIDPSHGVPLTLVERAIERKASDVEIDEYWCIFDIEWPKHHPNLSRAFDLARRNGVNIAFSNPCFELWLILHHERHTAFLNTHAAVSKRQQLDGRRDKGINAGWYVMRRAIACQRSERLVSYHAENDTKYPHDNPSSTMHMFIRAVEAPAGASGPLVLP